MVRWGSERTQAVDLAEVSDRDTIRPDLRPVIKKPVLKRGDRFGSLTVMECMGAHSQGHEYLLECDCGRQTFRTTGYLNQAIKRGYEPCCYECWWELRRGWAINRRQMRGERFLEAWAEWKSLYASSYDERETRVLLEEAGLEPELGITVFVPEELPSKGGEQPEGMTLQEIADNFEITRERIRQIESRALRKLRHPSRSRYLREFVGLEPRMSIKKVEEKPRRVWTNPLLLDEAIKRGYEEQELKRMEREEAAAEAKAKAKARAKERAETQAELRKSKGLAFLLGLDEQEPTERKKRKRKKDPRRDPRKRKEPRVLDLSHEDDWEPGSLHLLTTEELAEVKERAKERKKLRGEKRLKERRKRRARYLASISDIDAEVAELVYSCNDEPEDDHPF